MIKFEYKIFESEIKNLEIDLNKMGESGWELSGFSEASTHVVRLVFKRPQIAGTLALLG